MMWSQRGMTLVEVVVAATIFAVIMLATTTGFGTFARSYEALSLETAKTSRIREVDSFLRATFRDAVNLTGGFEGTGSEVRWVAPMDRVGSAGGLQHLLLRARSGELLLSFAPVDYRDQPNAEPHWGSVVEDYVLHDDLVNFAVSYRPDGETRWIKTSTEEGIESGSKALPAMVRLEIETHDGVWPPIIVALDQHGDGL